MTHFSSRRLTLCAMLAAIYAVISLALAPISFGVLQLRVAEALTLLAVFSPTTVWGLTLGCALTNAIGFFIGANILGAVDIFFGSLATLIAGCLSWWLRGVKIGGLPVLSALMPVLLNGIIIGGELMLLFFGGWNTAGFLLNAGQVALEELIVCMALGLPLVSVLRRTGLDQRLFGQL